MRAQYVVSIDANCKKTTNEIYATPRQGCFFQCQSTLPRSEIEGDNTEYPYSYKRGVYARETKMLKRIRILTGFYLECPNPRDWRATALPQPKVWAEDPEPTRSVGVCHPIQSAAVFPAMEYELGPPRIKNKRKASVPLDVVAADLLAEEETVIESAPVQEQATTCVDLVFNDFEEIANMLLADDADEIPDQARAETLHQDLEELLPLDMRRQRPVQQNEALFAIDIERLMAVHASLDVFMPPDLMSFGKPGP